MRTLRIVKCILVMILGFLLASSVMTSLSNSIILYPDVFPRIVYVDEDGRKYKYIKET